MNLQKFISETLYQILAGIKDAQDRASTIDVGELPKHNSPSVVPMPQSDKDRKLYEISFDVAVTVQEEENSDGGAGLSVMGIHVGGKASSAQTNSSVSRINFKIPVSYPYMIPKSMQ